MMAYVVPSTRVKEPIMRWLRRRLCPLRVKVLDVSQLQRGPREQEEDHKAQEDDGEKEEGNSFVLAVGEVNEWKGLAASRMQHMKLILIQDVEELCDAQEEEQEGCLQELLASLLSANKEKARVVALAGAIDERQVCDSWDHIHRCLQQHAQKEEVVELTFNSRYRYPLLNRQRALYE